MSNNDSVMLGKSATAQFDPNSEETKRCTKRVSTYTGCPDSVAIAEHIRRWHYSEERKAEVLRKLKQ